MRRWPRLCGLCLTAITLSLLVYLFRLVHHEAEEQESVSLLPSSGVPDQDRPVQCTYSTCFDASQCSREYLGHALNRIRVYVYPRPDGHRMSDQFRALVKALNSSRYAVPDPREACLFVPQLDMLNGLRDRADLTRQWTITESEWNHGVNHLLFNILPGRKPLVSGRAILAGGGHTSATYRPTFDVAIPAYNPLLKWSSRSALNLSSSRPMLLTILPTRSSKRQKQMQQLLSAYRGPAEGGNATVVLLHGSAPIDQSSAHGISSRVASISHTAYSSAQSPVTVNYEDVLAQSKFCAIVHADQLGYLGLFDAMALGCVPVLMDDNLVLPFSEVLDWSRMSIRVRRSNMSKILAILGSYGNSEIRQLQRQVHFVFDRYLSSMSKIAVTTLDIINDRVFPYYARSYAKWNDPDNVETEFPPAPALFYPPRVPSPSPFTVLIRGHDHFALLSSLLEGLQSVRGVERIVVVWTNANETVPAASLWPSLRVPLSIVPSKQPGSVNGRYYPYAQIRTEAVLSLDDHSCAPSATDIELALQLWSHNPGRLIGLSGLRAWYANGSDSASVNNNNNNPKSSPSILSASFGATIFHKHYLHAYTELISPAVHRLVDQGELCEDLLLNWLIVQLSGQSVLTTVSATQPSRNVPQQCHAEPYGACWTRLQRHMPQLVRIFQRAVPFRVAPVSADLR